MSSRPGGTPAGSSTVHMFPGQGDFSLRPLLRALPAASLTRALAEVFAEADVVAAEFGVAPIGPRLLGDRPPTTLALTEEPPGTIQLALFGVSLAIHRALESDGFGADRLLAVSFGELPALTAAECCSVADGARLACRLGQLLTHHGGGMTLLDAGPPQARRLLGLAGPDAASVVLACVNHGGETVVSGPLPGLSAVEALAAERGIRAQRLRLPFMSHHPGLAREAGVFAHFARRLRLSAPRRQVFSVVAGRTYDADSDLPRALSACLVRPFSLPAVVGAGLARGSLAVEAGTGGTLANAVRRIDPDRQTLAPFPDGLWQAAGRPPAPPSAPGPLTTGGPPTGTTRARPAPCEPVPTSARREP
ncbi:ACP S-malonyltransferase [Kitasatospora sp. NPDC127059]|uniref:ACP S-malonyltransferase n=1 Tax=unclassified Kitasatospora TaxID=2633591 RepID=UPI003655B463